MPILAGWNGDQKRVGNFGMSKCGHCGNWQPLGIYELSQKITLYFIPIAKWGKKYAIICPICKHGITIEGEAASNMLKRSVLLPDDETVLRIWRELDEFTDRELQKASGDIGEEELKVWLSGVEQLQDKMPYDEHHIKHVFAAYMEYLSEVFTNSKAKI